MNLEEKIKKKAYSLGFEIAGITTAEPLTDEQIQKYRDWLNQGNSAQMHYLHRNFEKRINPKELLTNAKSLICLGYQYKPQRSKINTSAQPQGRVANYALYPDYHKFLKTKLFELAQFTQSLTKENLKFKACVDSVPIAERAFAHRAGLGFKGKNTMLINPKIGSQFFLAELITTLKLTPDSPIEPQTCLNCNLCVNNCPTNALSESGSLNANLCINYLTIEHKGEIDENLSSKIGKNLFGCDRCIAVCPHEKNILPINKPDFAPDQNLEQISPQEILNMDENQFKERFANSPISRPGLQNLKRNAKICINNAKNK